MMSPAERETGVDRATLELERLSLENGKLRLELDEAARTGVWKWAGRLSPLLATMLAVAGFVFGVVQYTAQQRETRTAAQEQSRRELEARDRDFMKPLWERELGMYFRASEVAATIATTRDRAKREAAEEEFWRLYEGPLVIVEGKALSGAMKTFGACLSSADACGSDELRKRSRALASVIQETIQEAAALRLSEFSRNKFQYHR